MDTATISTALAVTDDTVTLARGTVPALDDLLAAYTANEPILVRGAAVAVADSTVTLTGTAARFLGRDGVAVRGDFTSRDDGAVAVTLLFDLASGARPWTFADSFPDLPDLGDGLYLDDVAVAGAAAVLTNVAGTDAVTHRPLLPGLTIVGDLDATSLLGVLAASVVASTLGDVTRVPMHAAVTMPLPGVPVPLEPLWPGRPWDAAGPVPGITLTADVPLAMALGGLTFDRTALRVYVPPTEDWADENPGYVPVVAFTGHLAIPSAAADLPVTATWRPGSRRLDVDGAFGDLVNLANLAALADLVHSGDGPAPDLAALLPEPVRARLGSVRLERAGVAVRFGDTVSVELAYATVAATGIGWEMFSGLTADEVHVDLTVVSPFGGGAEVVTGVGATLTLAGAPLEAYATFDGGVFVRIRLGRGAALPLNALFRQVAPALPPPPDLSVDSLSAQYASDGSYAVAATVAEDVPWTLDLGVTKLVVRNVAAGLTTDASGTSTASLSGQVEVAGVTLDAAYDSPGEFSIRADVPELRLSSLVAEFCPSGLPLPAFDVTLGSSYLLVAGDPESLTFTVASQVDGVGLVAFAAQRAESGTGVAVGIDLGAGRVSDLLDLPALAPLEGSIERLMVVLSTMERPAFQFPDLAAFQAPALPARGPRLPAHASGLVPGLNVYGLLRSDGDRGLGALLRFLGVPFDGTVGVTLAVALPDPGNGSRLAVAVDGTVSGVRIAGEAGLLLTGDQPGAYLSARAELAVDGQPVTGTVQAVVLAEGVLVQGSLEGTVTYGPLTLSDLALVVGVDWAGLPSLGVAATLGTSEFDASLAVFVNSTDPSESMLAGSITGATLGGVVRALAGAQVPADLASLLDGIGLRSLHAFTLPADAAKALDGADLPGVSAAFVSVGAPALPEARNRVLLRPFGDGWHLATIGDDGVTRYTLVRGAGGVDVRLDPQVYLVPREVRLAGLGPFRPRFTVDAEIDVWSIVARVRLDVLPSRGVTADVSVTPVDLFGVLRVTNEERTGGPLLSLATFADESRPDPATRQPHVHLSGAVSVLGATIASCYVDVTADGLVTRFTTSPAPFVTVNVHATATRDGMVGIGAGGTVGIGTLDLGPLGRVDVGTDATIQVDATADGGGIYGSLSVAVELLGQRWGMHPLDVALTADMLARAGDLVRAHAEALARDFLAVAERWARAVRDGLVAGIEGGEQIVATLGREFGRGATEAAAIARDVGCGAAEVAAGVQQAYGYAADETAAALRGAGYAADEAAGAIKSTFSLGAAQAVAALTAAGYEASAVATAVGDAFSLSASQVGDAFREAGRSMEEVAGVLRDAFGYSAAQAGDFVKNAYGASSDAVRAALDGAGYAANEVGNALGGLFQSISDSKANPSNW
ncbi:MAG TPA: hypothetical protein VF519_00595 [Mycobacteriales bacterium]|jgi:hypothetical protein